MKKRPKNILDAWLKHQKWTHERLARELGMSTVFVTNFVNGKNTDIRASTIVKLRDITGIPTDELLNFCTEQSALTKAAS